MRQTVGNIQGYDVIYVPEKRILFCKNTAVPMEVVVNPKASEWILKQPWLSQFVDNCMANGDSSEEIFFFLLGQCSASTVDSAFNWSVTSEGGGFWSEINDEMLRVSEDENWDDFDTTIEI